MKKISIITFALLSFFGIWLAGPQFLSNLALIARGGDDYIYWGLFGVLPAILVAFFVYKLIKSPKIYNNFRKTIYFSAIGIIITLSLVVVTVIRNQYVREDMELLTVILMFIGGIIISFILTVIGLVFDLKNKNRIINNNAEK